MPKLILFRVLQALIHMLLWCDFHALNYFISYILHILRTVQPLNFVPSTEGEIYLLQ